MTEEHDADFLETGFAVSDPAPELAAARNALSQSATYHDLPAGLEDAVVAAIASEAAVAQTPLVEEQAGPLATPIAGPVDELARRRRQKFAGPLLAAAAVVVAVALFGAGLLVGGGDDTPEPELAVVLNPTELAPDASAVAEFRDTSSGLRVALIIDDLAPASSDTYYQGWVRTTEGDTITIGTFHMRGGTEDPVVLWAGVDLQDIEALGVTIQTIDGGPASSGQAVLRASIGPSE